MNALSNIRAILLDKQSLTQKLKGISKYFQVKLLQENWALPDSKIATEFGIALSEKIFKRSVALCEGDQVWILANTFIPQKTIEAEPELIHLGNRSLGSILFSHPNMRRSEISLDENPDWGNWETLSKSFSNVNLTQARVRSSLFYLNDQPLLVQECFLKSALMALSA